MNSSYCGEYSKKISFPLGGIGTGSIGLSGIGRLIDWEIFNRPNKESYNGYTHFAIKAEQGGRVVDARILQGDITDDFLGKGAGSNHSWGIGHGPNRCNLGGMPHFRNVNFKGEFPIATVEYRDDKFPGIVNLTAFNPFIPSDSKNSSIPVNYFEYEVHNPTNDELTYTVAFVCSNPFREKTINKYSNSGDVHSIIMESAAYKEDDTRYGNLCISTTTQDISYQEYMYRGKWFDDLTTYWKEFATLGPLKNRSYDEPRDCDYNTYQDNCILAPKVTLKPYESKKILFSLSWYIPNVENYWNKNVEGEPNCWKNYYTTLFSSSEEVAHYSLSNFEDLKKNTKLFKDALFSTTMPSSMVDAIQGTITVLKSSATLRLESGEFYSFEGTNINTGSCEGSCTHVWNYAYALPFFIS